MRMVMPFCILECGRGANLFACMCVCVRTGLPEWFIITKEMSHVLAYLPVFQRDWKEGLEHVFSVVKTRPLDVYFYRNFLTGWCVVFA